MKKLRTIIIFLLLTIIALSAQAQMVIIKGRVTDDKQQPIEIANVKVEGQAAGTVTDLKGNYIFSS